MFYLKNIFYFRFNKIYYIILYFNKYNLTYIQREKLLKKYKL